MLSLDKSPLLSPSEIAATLGQAPDLPLLIDLLRDRPPFAVSIESGKPLGAVVSTLGVYGPPLL